MLLISVKNIIIPNSKFKIDYDHLIYQQLSTFINTLFDVLKICNDSCNEFFNINYDTRLPTR